MRNRLLVVFFFLGIVFQLIGQTDKPDLASYYDSQLFKYTYSTFGGFALTFQGQSSGLDWGAPPTFVKALSMYPESKELIDLYTSRNLAGNILYWGGAAVGFVGAILPFATGDIRSSTITTTEYVALGMCFSGLISNIIGVFVRSAGFSDATNAVNVYNRRRIEDYGSK